MADERDERTRETDRTTVVTTGGGGGGGAGTAVAVLLAIVLIVILLLLAFGGWVRDSTDVDIPDKVGVNINIDQPTVETPPVEVPEAPPQDQGNTAR